MREPFRRANSVSSQDEVIQDDMIQDEVIQDEVIFRRICHDGRKLITK